MMHVSEEGKELIASFEGQSLTAYRCPAGIWTIGIGSTVPKVNPGDTITTEQMWKRFDADIAKYVESVSGALEGRPTSQHEFDAMVSLAFNIGIAGFQQSTVLRLHKAGNKQGAASAFSMWNKATVGGKLEALPGLTRRRLAEAAHYLTPDEAAVKDIPMPQSVVAEQEAPDGYTVLPSGNIVLPDVKQSTIVKDSNKAAGTLAVVGAVGSAATGAAGFATADWKTVLAFGFLLLLAGMGFAVWKILKIKEARLEMSRKGIA